LESLLKSTSSVCLVQGLCGMGWIIHLWFLGWSGPVSYLVVWVGSILVSFLLWRWDKILTSGAHL
jgi:hypothetical protein